jgi:hypothetical protein
MRHNLQFLARWVLLFAILNATRLCTCEKPQESSTHPFHVHRCLHHIMHGIVVSSRYILVRKSVPPFRDPYPTSRFHAPNCLHLFLPLARPLPPNTISVTRILATKIHCPYPWHGDLPLQQDAFAFTLRNITECFISLLFFWAVSLFLPFLAF